MRNKPYTDYYFVVETSLQSSGNGLYSLCVEIEKTRLALSYTIIGYVLAPNECAPETAMFGLLQGEAPEAKSLLPSQVETYIAQGVFPADLPLTPELPLLERIRATFTLYLFGFFFVVGIVVAGFKAFAGVRHKPENRELATGLLSVMWHVACADGTVTKQEIDLIAKHVRAACGVDLSHRKIMTMAKTADYSVIAGEFVDVARMLNTEQRKTALRSAVMVAAADGEISAIERTLIAGLSEAFGLNCPV